jgi:hypothetical protein
MAKKTPPKKVQRIQRVREDVEIEAGIYPMPGVIEEDGEGAEGELLIWGLAGGDLLGQEPGRTGEQLGKAGPLLREAFKQLPFLPGVLRVASPELAAALRPEISGRIRLVTGPTPELDAIAAEIAEAEDEMISYLGAGAGEEAVAEFFRAAARLYRTQPWKTISSEDLIGVTIEELSIADEAVVVIGPSRTTKGGWLLASDPEELDDYVEALEREEAGEAVTFPPIEMMVYEQRTDLLPELAEEIAKHRWEVAGPKAFPSISALGPDGGLELPEEQDFALGTLISIALAGLAEKGTALKKALAGHAPPLVHETEVELNGDRILVVLTAPYQDDEALVERPDHPILGALYDLEGEEEIDHDERERLEKQLFAQFAASGLGKGRGRLEFVPQLLEVAAEVLGVTAASLVDLLLEDLLLEIYPRKVVMSPDLAGPLVEECKAFFQFLADDCEYEYSQACVELLEKENFVEDFRAALVDPAKFGFGKTALAGGPAALAEKPEKSRGPSPAERNKTKSAGPATGSSRRKR